MPTNETSPPVQETAKNDASSNPIKNLADGWKNKLSTQILMVQPASVTTLTFDGKSEKIEFFEDFFHTMNKVQPDMPEAMKNKTFSFILRKHALPALRSINRHTLEVILVVFRRKYVKQNSETTAKHE